MPGTGFVSDLNDATIRERWPEPEFHEGTRETLASYGEKVERLWERCDPGCKVLVVNTGSTRPERFMKHMGKTVEAHGVMWEVINVLPVVKTCDWESDGWDAECFWIYQMIHKVKEYDKMYARHVRCTDLLSTLLPKGLVVQEEKMKTVMKNAWDENLKLHALKRVKTQGNVEASEVSGSRAT